MTAKRSVEWSATGAARAAREARIATAQHLRETEFARQWLTWKLQASYRVKLAYAGDELTAATLLLDGLGFEPPYPRTIKEAADWLAHDEARNLGEAELYILSPQMCDVVIAAADSLTQDDLQFVTEDDLPSPTGLVMLPHPILVRTIVGDLADYRAINWRFPASGRHPAVNDDDCEESPAIRVSCYYDTHGPVQPDTFREIAASARARGTPLPPLLVNAARRMPIRYIPTDAQVRSWEHYKRAAREVGEDARTACLAEGHDENLVVGEYTPDSEITDHDDTFVFRFLYAFWRLCEQRIAIMEDAETNHSARIRAERAGVPAEVRVVRLRELESHGNTNHAGRDWQHRWVVRMHKVRHWFPKEECHKVIYRGPYIKGPVDKPLLGGETVRGLVR